MNAPAAASAGPAASIVGPAARAIVSRTLHLAPTLLWRRLFPKTAVGVCYHVVSDHRLAHIKHYRFLNRAEFEADVNYLRERFGFIGYEELAARRAGPAVIRDNAAILTFDDGFAECAAVAAPILRRLGVPAVFFVVTDLIDNQSVFRESAAALCIDSILSQPPEQVLSLIDALGMAAHLRVPPKEALHGAVDTPLRMADLEPAPDPRLGPLLHWLLTVGPEDAALLERVCERLGVAPQDYLQRVRPYLTTEQIRQMAQDGFTIGAHGRRHLRLQNLSPEEAEREIVGSCQAIREITGQASVPFAFPYSGAGIDRGWLNQLRQRCDFIGLLFDTDGLREDDPAIVQRVFGERFGRDRTMDAILRRAWSRRSAWRLGA